MQGNCAAAPPSAASLGLSGAPLLPLLPYQCLLITDMQLLQTDFNSELWLNGLYIRYRRTTRIDQPISEFILTAGNLWMTAVTLQGDGVSHCREMGMASATASHARLTQQLKGMFTQTVFCPSRSSTRVQLLKRHACAARVQLVPHAHSATAIDSNMRRELQ
jgi:hypothetical protein